ncbi:MAG: hypothetical protein ACE5G0_21125 [Rhodothermales bacterium]
MYTIAKEIAKDPRNAVAIYQKYAGGPRLSIRAIYQNIRSVLRSNTVQNGYYRHMAHSLRQAITVIETTFPSEVGALSAAAGGAAGWMSRIGGFLARGATGLVNSITAFVTGTTVPAWVTALVAAAVIGAAIYGVVNWGKPDAPPVHAGSNMANRYYVVMAHGIGSGGNGILSVRSEGVIENGKLVKASFRHGGRSREQAHVEKISGPHTIEEATHVVASRIAQGSLHSPPLADGWVATVGGKTMTIDDWGSIDFSLLREVVQ